MAPEPDTIRLYRSIRAQRHGQAFPLVRSSAGNRNSGQQPWAIDGFAEKAARDEDHPRKGRSKPSIAVLPFVRIGGDLEEDDFADGLTEDIITDLSRVSALFVRRDTHRLHLQGQGCWREQAARELGVSHVLEGSVRKAGGRVRITAQLVDGATGDHLWATATTRSLRHVRPARRRSPSSIVDILKVKLLPQELERPARLDHERRRLSVLPGGTLVHLRGIDKHGLRIAREMFAKAVEIEFRGLCTCICRPRDLANPIWRWVIRTRRIRAFWPTAGARSNLTRIWRRPTPSRGWLSMPRGSTPRRRPNSSAHCAWSPTFTRPISSMRGTAASRVSTSKRRLCSSARRPCGQMNIARSGFWPNPIRCWVGGRNSWSRRESVLSGSRRRSRHIPTMQAPWPSAVPSWPRQAKGREPRTGRPGQS